MRMLVGLIVMVVLAGSARAQPGQTPAYSYGYEQRPVMPVQLTVDEQWLLERGFISNGEQLGGGVVALLFGWGIGHAVQGRWSQKGYIFTLGEAVSGGVMIYGMVQLMSCFEGCSQQREERYVMLLAAGAIAASVFRIWEIYDAFAGPSAHNRRLFELRARLGMPTPMYARIQPYIAPNHSSEGGGVAGVSLRF